LDKILIKSPIRHTVLSGFLTVFLCTGVCTHAQGVFPGHGSKAEWTKANGFYDEGNQLLQAKKYAEAANKYQQAVSLYGSDYHYHYNLGLALKNTGDLPGAIKALRDSLALNSRDWRAWKLLGNCLYKTNDFAGAKDAFQHGIAGGAPAKEAAEMRKGIGAAAARSK
jgi:tetratricopeptide (TPR) repeat protein